jgi:deoxyribonuclease-4
MEQLSMPIGIHVYEKSRPIHTAILEEIDRLKLNGLTMSCAQIYAIGPKDAKENLSEDDKINIKKIVEETGIKIYIHVSYLSNPWGTKSAFGRHLLKRELDIASDIGAKGIVMHLSKTSADLIAQYIVTIPTTVKIFLEIESYKASTNTYETPNKLKNLFNKIIKLDETASTRIGLCIDTAHVWSAGVDISTRQKMTDWLDEIDQINVEKIVHLNDQVYDFGSGRDKHAPLTFGTIWSKYNHETGIIPISESGLATIISWAIKNNINMILERNDDEPKDANMRPLCLNVDSDTQVVLRCQ